MNSQIHQSSHLRKKSNTACLKTGSEVCLDEKNNYNYDYKTPSFDKSTKKVYFYDLVFHDQIQTYFVSNKTCLGLVANNRYQKLLTLFSCL